MLLRKIGEQPARAIEGTWGLVLAPERFYTGSPKRVASYNRALGLIGRMAKMKTEARVILGVWNPQRQVISYKGGYWPQ